VSFDQVRPTHTSGIAAIALLFGLLALVLCWIPPIGVLAFPLGTVALVTAVVGIRSTRMSNVAGRSLAIVGLVTGTIALAVATYLLVVFLLGFQGPAWRGDVHGVREWLNKTEGR
jgi:hypothetical protein